MTGDARVVRALALNWGVTALHFAGAPEGDGERRDEAMIEEALAHLRSQGRTRPGDVVVATTGISRERGSTNRIAVIPV